MIFRTPRRTLPFTQISNELISAHGLSWKAKGILIYILSKPENWLVYEKDIVNRARDGRDAVRSAIQELIKAGYITRKQVRNDKGKFTSYEYRVSETPDFTTTPPKTDFPASDNPTSDNPTLSNTEYRDEFNLYEEQKFQRGERGNIDEPLY